jgi:hypothetical protein
MPDDFFKKNVEMWEQFSSSYMDTMFKTVERALTQSEALKDQVDQAVNSAVSNQMEATMTVLKAMQHQLEILTEKVDEMMEQEKE